MKDKVLEELKMKYGRNAPKLFERLFLYLSIASITSILPIIAISYFLLELAPVDVPWYLVVSLAPVYVVIAKWVFSSVLLLLARVSIRPVEEGEYEMDMKNGNVRNWLINGVVTRLALNYFGTKPFGMPALGVYPLRMLRAKMGYGTQANIVTDPYLVEFGDGTIAGAGSLVTSHAFVGGRLVIGKVKIGRNVTLGVYSVILPGVEIGDNSVVAPLSTVASKTRIPPNQFWAGNPARKVGIVTKDGKIRVLEKEKS